MKETLKSLSAKGTRPIGNYGTRATACAVSEQVGCFWPLRLSAFPSRGMRKAFWMAHQQAEADLDSLTEMVSLRGAELCAVRCLVREAAMRTSDSAHGRTSRRGA